MLTECLFCKIVRGENVAHIVYEDKVCIAFLDKRPLFAGHVLLIPREHVSTLSEIDAPWGADLFNTICFLSGVVEKAMGAQGTFVAVNNKVSQSVPHLHVHIVPRTKGDGLRGFFWPRHPYKNEEEMRAVAQRIREAISEPKE